MSYGELSKYIADLSQSGFDTVKLRVQLANKLAVPAITLVMAIIAVPFAVSMGKRGGLAGIATAIGVAIGYWVVAAYLHFDGRHQHASASACCVVARSAVRGHRLAICCCGLRPSYVA